MRGVTVDGGDASGVGAGPDQIGSAEQRDGLAGLAEGAAGRVKHCRTKTRKKSDGSRRGSAVGRWATRAARA
ncbi:hypothetical protein DBP18_21530 [Streptomyces sp. CS081A]|nr:hypothetical protein DBP18_21530 [Streptomyces sp. CS081A]